MLETFETKTFNRGEKSLYDSSGGEWRWNAICDYFMEHGGSISEAREATAGGGPGGASANPGYASGNGSINEDVDAYWGAKMDGYGGTMADFTRGDGIKTDNNGRSYFWVTSYALDYAKNDGYKVPEDSKLLIGGTVIETKRYLDIQSGRSNPPNLHFTDQEIRGMMGLPEYYGGIAPVSGFAKGSKFVIQLSKQLTKDGPKSILKSYNKIQSRLLEHQNKLPDLQYKSSVEREIRTFSKQLEILEEFMKSHGIIF